MAVMSQALWEKKMETLRSFGLSEDEIHLAFRLQPMCMITLEKKLKKLLGFYIDSLNMKPSMISKHPNILLLSLEKRVIPRCSVLQLLLSAGLLKEEIKIIYMIRMTEKRFKEKIILKYLEILPDVAKAHRGKIKFQGFPIPLKM